MLSPYFILPHPTLLSQSLLVIGCGDVGLRVVRALRGRLRIVALTSSPARRAELRESGVLPLAGDLDQPETLNRLGGLAESVLYLAPPPSIGRLDPRMQALLRALSRRSPPRRFVYISTTGVYGHCGLEWVDETRPLSALTDRACRRVDAERQVRVWSRSHGVRATILRVPGIYALDRVGAHPQNRLLRGTPSLRPEDDVITNHIHADDLARVCIAALWRGRPQRAIHVRDESCMLAGDYYDLIADLCGLPRAPRVARADAVAHFSALQLSFLGESRRLRNDRMKRELGLRLRWPTVRECLLAKCL